MIAYEWVVWFILLLPLAAFVIVGLVGRRLPEGGGPVVVGAMAGSFVLSVYVFVQVLMQGALGGNFSQTIVGYVWLPGRLPAAALPLSLRTGNRSAWRLLGGSVWSRA